MNKFKLGDLVLSSVEYNVDNEVGWISLVSKNNYGDYFYRVQWNDTYSNSYYESEIFFAPYNDFLDKVKDRSESK